LDWRPAPGTLGQKGESMPPLWWHPQRIPNLKRKKFFSIWTRRLDKSVEGLNTSLAQSAGKLNGVAKLGPRSDRRGTEGLEKICWSIPCLHSLWRVFTLWRRLER